MLVYGLDTASSPHRHENGCGDIAMVGADDTCTGVALRVFFYDVELHNYQLFSVSALGVINKWLIFILQRYKKNGK